jgi:hypothetical protein
MKARHCVCLVRSSANSSDRPSGVPVGSAVPRRANVARIARLMIVASSSECHVNTQRSKKSFMLDVHCVCAPGSSQVVLEVAQSFLVVLYCQLFDWFGETERSFPVSRLDRP